MDKKPLLAVQHKFTTYCVLIGKVTAPGNPNDWDWSEVVSSEDYCIHKDKQSRKVFSKWAASPLILTFTQENKLYEVEARHENYNQYGFKDLFANEYDGQYSQINLLDNADIRKLYGPKMSIKEIKKSKIGSENKNSNMIKSFYWQSTKTCIYWGKFEKSDIRSIRKKIGSISENQTEIDNITYARLLNNNENVEKSVIYDATRQSHKL